MTANPNDRPEARQAVDLLARDYLAKAVTDPGFDADQYFTTLRRLVESRAQTEALIARNGAMGGGGADEA